MTRGVVDGGGARATRLRRSPTAARRALMLGFAALTLVACSTKSEVSTLTSKQAAVTPGSIVALDVKALGGDDAAEVSAQVRDLLFGKLVSRGKFAAVRPAGDPEAVYDLDVTLSDIDKVSVGARIFLGVFAGGDELTATTTLKDRATGAVQNQFQVQTEAAAHLLSSDYGIDSALNQLTDRIVSGL